MARLGLVLGERCTSLASAATLGWEHQARLLALDCLSFVWHHGEEASLLGQRAAPGHWPSDSLDWLRRLFLVIGAPSRSTSGRSLAAGARTETLW